VLVVPSACASFAYSGCLRGLGLSWFGGSECFSCLGAKRCPLVPGLVPWLVAGRAVADSGAG
jgi:hypothetical protein